MIYNSVEIPGVSKMEMDSVIQLSVTLFRAIRFRNEVVRLECDGDPSSPIGHG